MKSRATRVGRTIHGPIDLEKRKSEALLATALVLQGSHRIVDLFSRLVAFACWIHCCTFFLLSCSENSPSINSLSTAWLMLLQHATIPG